MDSDTAGGHANIELVRAAFAAFNSGKLDNCSEFITDDFIINIAGMPFQMRGRDAWRDNAEVMHSAFPDVEARIEDIFSADDRVAVRLTMRGTHGASSWAFRRPGAPWSTRASRSIELRTANWPRSGSRRTSRR